MSYVLTGKQLPTISKADEAQLRLALGVSYRMESEYATVGDLGLGGPVGEEHLLTNLTSFAEQRFAAVSRSQALEGVTYDSKNPAEAFQAERSKAVFQQRKGENLRLQLESHQQSHISSYFVDDDFIPQQRDLARDQALTLSSMATSFNALAKEGKLSPEDRKAYAEALLAAATTLPVYKPTGAEEGAAAKDQAVNAQKQIAGFNLADYQNNGKSPGSAEYLLEAARVVQEMPGGDSKTQAQATLREAALKIWTDCKQHQNTNADTNLAPLSAAVREALGPASEDASPLEAEVWRDVNSGVHFDQLMYAHNAELDLAMQLLAAHADGDIEEYYKTLKSNGLTLGLIGRLDSFVNKGSTKEEAREALLSAMTRFKQESASFVQDVQALDTPDAGLRIMSVLRSADSPERKRNALARIFGGEDGDAKAARALAVAGSTTTMQSATTAGSSLDMAEQASRASKALSAARQGQGTYVAQGTPAMEAIGKHHHYVNQSTKQFFNDPKVQIGLMVLDQALTLGMGSAFSTAGNLAANSQRLQTVARVAARVEQVLTTIEESKIVKAYSKVMDVLEYADAGQKIAGVSWVPSLDTVKDFVKNIAAEHLGGDLTDNFVVEMLPLLASARGGLKAGHAGQSFNMSEQLLKWSATSLATATTQKLILPAYIKDPEILKQLQEGLGMASKLAVMLYDSRKGAEPQAARAKAQEDAMGMATQLDKAFAKAGLTFDKTTDQELGTTAKALNDHYQKHWGSLQKGGDPSEFIDGLTKIVKDRMEKLGKDDPKFSAEKRKELETQLISELGKALEPHLVRAAVTLGGQRQIAEPGKAAVQVWGSAGAQAAVAGHLTDSHDLIRQAFGQAKLSPDSPEFKQHASTAKAGLTAAASLEIAAGMSLAPDDLTKPGNQSELLKQMQAGAATLVANGVVPDTVQAMVLIQTQVNIKFHEAIGKLDASGAGFEQQTKDLMANYQQVQQMSMAHIHAASAVAQVKPGLGEAVTQVVRNELMAHLAGSAAKDAPPLVQRLEEKSYEALRQAQPDMSEDEARGLAKQLTNSTLEGYSMHLALSRQAEKPRAEKPVGLEEQRDIKTGQRNLLVEMGYDARSARDMAQNAYDQRLELTNHRIAEGIVPGPEQADAKKLALRNQIFSSLQTIGKDPQKIQEQVKVLTKAFQESRNGGMEAKAAEVLARNILSAGLSIETPAKPSP
ncbi:MAG: hypothetical protein ACAI44_07265 [Candidatus Sericytochromatia bacterium]